MQEVQQITHLLLYVHLQRILIITTVSTLGGQNSRSKAALKARICHIIHALTLSTLSMACHPCVEKIKLCVFSGSLRGLAVDLRFESMIKSFCIHSTKHLWIRPYIPWSTSIANFHASCALSYLKVITSISGKHLECIKWLWISSVLSHLATDHLKTDDYPVGSCKVQILSHWPPKHEMLCNKSHLLLCSENILRRTEQEWVDACSDSSTLTDLTAWIKVPDQSHCADACLNIGDGGFTTPEDGINLFYFLCWDSIYETVHGGDPEGIEVCFDPCIATYIDDSSFFTRPGAWLKLWLRSIGLQSSPDPMSQQEGRSAHKSGKNK